jgi:hypothetical protein
MSLMLILPTANEGRVRFRWVMVRWGHLAERPLFRRIVYDDVEYSIFGRLAPVHEVSSGRFRFDCQTNV